MVPRKSDVTVAPREGMRRDDPRSRVVFERKVRTGGGIYIDSVSRVTPLGCLLLGSAAVCYEPPEDAQSGGGDDGGGGGGSGGEATRSALVQDGWLATVAPASICRALQKLQMAISVMVEASVANKGGGGGGGGGGHCSGGGGGGGGGDRGTTQLVDAVAKLLLWAERGGGQG